MRHLSLAALACLASSCIVEAPTAASGSQPAAAAAAPRRPAAPPIEIPSGANFGDKVELASVLVSPSRATIGEPLRVALKLKVTAPMDADYMIFVHVEDVDGKVDRINVDHAPARGARPTSQWKAGEMIVDDFEVPVPPQMQVRGLNIILGFWDPKTDGRLKIVNADRVKTDGRDRLFAAQIPLDR